eukprot:7019789-Ditylum_brightwellii.AAC.1
MPTRDKQNLKQVKVYNDIKHLFNKVWGKYKIVTSKSQERTKKEYQPGGTATVVMDKWVSQVRNSGCNPLGHWSYASIKGRKDRKVTIISAYRVCENSLDQAGPATCWLQQWQQLKKQGRGNPNP